MALFRVLILFFFLVGVSQAYELFERSSYENLLKRAREAKVIYLGEVHDDEKFHKFQLRVIKDLHKDFPIVILMEAFQQQFQDALDSYVDCEIGEDEMLAKTEYKKRWRFPKKLYAPIWRFAKEHAIRLFALNIPSELLKEVRKRGLKSVISRYLPKKLMDFRPQHKRELLEVFKKHKGSDEKTFLDVQLAWDSGMAYRVAKLALAYPNHKLVVIVGAGHVKDGLGIPERVNFLLGEVPQLVVYLEEGRIYFLFSKDFSKESSSANSSKVPN